MDSQTCAVVVYMTLSSIQAVLSQIAFVYVDELANRKKVLVIISNGDILCCYSTKWNFFMKACLMQ